MNIRIKSLILVNFKCFHDKRLTFDGNITTIKGRNGVGKTTIADSILFCLFGKNTMGQSDLDIFKTRRDGKIIPNLDHSVELTLTVDEKEVTLKRSIKEVWVKKRGTDELVFKNNTVEYFVDGANYTQADYKKYINSLIDEETFRIITSPTYFTSKKWQEQREFLSRMAGEIQPEEIANTQELADLVRELDTDNENIVTHLKHLSYQIKQVKDKLDKIPVRLEEQHKALPEKLDWEAIEKEQKVLSEKVKKISDDIISIKSGNGDEVEKEKIREQIKSIRSKIDLMESMATSKVREQREEKEKEISKFSRRFNDLLNDQRDLENSIKSLDMLAKRCDGTLNQCEMDTIEIRRQWADNRNRSISFNESDQFCPTCGQFLPEDKVRENREIAKQQLKESKANVYAELREKAAKVTELQESTKSELEGIKEKKAAAEKLLEETKENINITFSEKAKKEKIHIPSVEELLKDDDEYTSACNQITLLKASLEQNTTSDDDTEKIKALEEEKRECEKFLNEINAQLATQTQYERILSFISGIEEEQKNIITQLSELERKQDIANQYQFRMNQVLEERINKHFTLVQWRLFRTVNNGGDSFDEPYCECYVDGIPYHSGLNQAMRLNAGLDIINGLCLFFGIAAPIVLDNAESTLTILRSLGQQIRLEVFDSDLQVL